MWSKDGGTESWRNYDQYSRVGSTLVDCNASGFREYSTLSYDKLRNNTKLLGKSIKWLQGLSKEEMLEELDALEFHYTNKKNRKTKKEEQDFREKYKGLFRAHYFEDYGDLSQIFSEERVLLPKKANKRHRPKRQRK
jgi:hypothetical protein